MKLEIPCTVKGFLQLMAEDYELEKYNSHYKLMIEEIDRVNNIDYGVSEYSKNQTKYLQAYFLKSNYNGPLPVT
ncbi:hypothetical protein KHA80_08280 [Anaerobacillus sp. HL2]|nr:hypothetical protein KHA80_08280 [Anaerobacillus sp. HL2]